MITPVLRVLFFLLPIDLLLAVPLLCALNIRICRFHPLVVPEIVDSFFLFLWLGQVARSAFSGVTK